MQGNFAASGGDFQGDQTWIDNELSACKVRFKGLQKNTAHLLTLFALSNLWMARRQLIGLTGQVRPKAA